MVKRKYTLPRHTNLAKNSSRTGAFFVDFAIFLAVTLAFFFGCFNLIFRPLTTPLREEKDREQINSHLRAEKDGRAVGLEATPEETYEVYGGAITYYFLNYLTGEGIDKDVASRTYDELIENDEGVLVPKKDFYTVAWVNKNVFGITKEDPDSDKKILFTYQKDDLGNYDKTKIAIPKPVVDAPTKDVSSYLRTAYSHIYQGHFQRLDYVYNLTNKMNFLYTLEFVLSAIIGAIGTYVLIPIILKDGKTAGKKAFGLALANKDGYRFSNVQLAMRVMPLIVCILASLIPIWKSIATLTIVYIVIFLVSFAVAMASPYKAALHDFTARTIVVDYRTSILFNNELEEEKYLLEEDNILPEENEGEEPEISYEK